MNKIYILHNGEYKILTLGEKITIKDIEYQTFKEVSTIITIEELQKILDKQEMLQIRYEVQEEKRKQQQAEEKKEMERKIKEKEDYNFCNGYTDNLTPLQAGKVLKVLNKIIFFNGKSITRKEWIHMLINKNSSIKEVMLTNRYSEKKVDLCYKKHKDKKEYRFYDDNDDSFYTVTKTEYEYIKYLLENKLY